MEQIKAVIFDFGSVLDIPEDRDDWLAQRDHLAASVGMTGKALWKHIFVNDAWPQAEVGAMTNDEFWADRLLPLGLHSREERDDFARRLFAGRNHIHSAMRAIIERLQGRYVLAVLSNTGIRNMADWIAAEVGFPGVFDHVIGSADVGLMKPDPAIFRLTLERLGVLPAEALFIDDYQQNIDAAVELGIEGILFESPEKLEAALAKRGLFDGQNR